VEQVWSGLLLAPLEKGDPFMGKRIKYKFTPIDNKMFEALIKLKLPLYDRAVFDTVVRQTIGYHLPEAWIAWSRFTKITGIDKRHVSRSIKSLIKKGMISKNGKIYSIQTDLSKWEGVPVEAHLEEGPQEAHLGTSGGTLDVPVEAQTKETPKEIDKRKVFSKAKDKKRKEQFMEGLHGLMKDIGSSPGKKKENYRLIKKSQDKEKQRNLKD
jgi:phage replication O-like protein O